MVAAQGGAEALELLAQQPRFDLIVCDLLMPGLNGMEVYRRVCEMAPDLDGTFVFVTGGSADKDVQVFLRTIGNQVLQKPFDFSTLSEIIEARKARGG